VALADPLGVAVADLATDALAMPDVVAHVMPSAVADWLVLPKTSSFATLAAGDGTM
jgi:hypothetical protein